MFDDRSGLRVVENACFDVRYMLKPHVFCNFHFYDIPSVYFIKNNSKASGCIPILTTILTGLPSEPMKLLTAIHNAAMKLRHFPHEGFYNIASHHCSVI